MRMRERVADAAPETRTRVELLIRKIKELRKAHERLMEKSKREISLLQMTAIVRGYREGDAKIVDRSQFERRKRL